MIKKSFLEIAQELKKLIQPQPLYEMSKAFSYKDRRIDVCAWVENPMATDNKYFKYYNSSSIDMATMVARIRIDRPTYVGGTHRERNLKKWILTDKEKKELVQILSGNSLRYIGYTRWHDIIITYNFDNFNLTPEQTISGDLDDSQRSPRMPKHLMPLAINTPMPDYIKLGEN